MEILSYLVRGLGVIVGATCAILYKEKRHITFFNFFERAALVSIGVSLGFGICLTVKTILFS